MLGIVFFFLGAVLNAQHPETPFELERYPETAYSLDEYTSEKEQLSREELFEAYFTAYKKERAQNPGNYFPSPGEDRKGFGQSIRGKYPNGPETTLIRFLEEGCSNSSLQSVLKIDPAFTPALPYRALAAFVLDEPEAEKILLKKLDREGFLSPTLKNWGAVAVRSAQGYGSIMTNGLQDLLAVRYAQLIGGEESEMEVVNRLVLHCSSEKDEAAAFADMWIAPTVEARIFSPFASRLQIVGIGFALMLKDGDHRLDDASKKISDQEALTPADRGLVSSYRYLLKALKAKGEEKKAKALEEFIVREGMQ